MLHTTKKMFLKNVVTRYFYNILTVFDMTRVQFVRYQNILNVKHKTKDSVSIKYFPKRSTKFINIPCIMFTPLWSSSRKE